MNLTERQRQAVEHRGANLLVSASAGSGKTEVLARRCVSLIADPERPLDVDRLLVVTFTRAAAAELRARIGRMLREQAGRSADDRRLRRHLRRQEALIETAEIGTIDAWCARLAREHFDRLTPAVDPAFSVLGAEEATILRGDVLDELFEWIYQADDEMAALGRRWIRRHAEPSDDFLRKMVRSLNRYREHLVNPETWLARQLELCSGHDETSRRRAAGVLAEALNDECTFQSDQIMDLIAELESSKVRDQLTSYSENLTDWTVVEAKAKNVAAAVGKIAAYRFPRKPREISARDTALREEIKKRWFEKRLKQRWDPSRIESILLRAGETAVLTTTLQLLERRYHDLLSARKRSRGAYEFGDVLRMALDLLGASGDDQQREPTPIASALQRRYEHILVDEYQDTSPVQVELLRLATRAAPGAGTRFMVGDVKQSIYGFREAAPRLLSGLMKAYKEKREEGRVLFLPDNFRSHARLVEGLNRIFAGLFNVEFGGARYEGEERLIARRAEIENPSLDAEPRIEMHLVSAGADREQTASETPQVDEIPLERIEREACVAAQRIHELFETKTRIPELTEAGVVRTRPIRWSDIVILLRSAKVAASRLAVVLRAAGIPCVAAGRESILDSLEVRDVLTAMSLTVNRRQDIPLAAYLRGPMVGLSAGQLLSIRKHTPDGAFYQAVQDYRGDPTLAAEIEQAMARLESWSVAARTETLPVLLRRIIRETSLEFFARALPGGEHRAAMLQALVTMATDFARRGQNGLAEFVDRLDELDERDITPETSAAVGDDAVRIMTIHAANGLEFPVVFLLGAGTEFSRRPRRDSLECDEHGGIGLEFFDYPARTRLARAAFDVNRRKAVQRELEEELRLLYVAATRAREKLFVVGHLSENAWLELRARYADGGGHIPLISRLGAACMLEWLMQGTACGKLEAAAGENPPAVRVDLHRADELTTPKPTQRPKSPTPTRDALTEAERAWIEHGKRAIQAEPDLKLARQPAVLSVSDVKQLTSRDQGEETPWALEYSPTLLPPALGDVATTDGRTVGDAYHRFMQLADLRRIASEDHVRRQMSELKTGGRMTDAETALIEPGDIAWFAETELGRLLIDGADSCLREAPFVHAYPVGDGGESMILRGVIDCLLDAGDEFIVLDYKTDRPSGERGWRRRLAGYSLQLQLYANAAAEVFGRPVRAAELVFLREHRIESVDIRPPTLALIMARLRESTSVS